MDKMIAGIMIGAAILIALVLIIRIRNNFVTLHNRVKNQMAQIDVQLKRRFDLIPNLLETAKGYACFEKSTLESVVKARTSAMAAADFNQVIAANEKLSSSLRQLSGNPLLGGTGIRAGNNFDKSGRHEILMLFCFI